MHVDKQLTNYSHCFIMGCVSEMLPRAFTIDIIVRWDNVPCQHWSQPLLSCL